MRRVIWFLAERVPYGLGPPHVLAARFLEGGFTQGVASLPPCLAGTVERDWIAIDRGEHQIVEPFQTGGGVDISVVIARSGRVRPAKRGTFPRRHGQECRLKDDVFVMFALVWQHSKLHER